MAALMSRVAAGEVRIPEFQRELAWTSQDGRELVDSIYRGYPVGTMIFWERAAPAGILNLGSLKVVANELPNALWVVDGQQRITSLSRMLLSVDARADLFATFFDLDDDRFVSAKSLRKTDDPSRFVPLTEVLDAVKLQLWVTAARLDERRMTAAFRLGSRIREYSIPTYVVKTSNEAVLREMFGRLNSTGKSLKDDEVFNALHGVRGTQRVRDLRDLVAFLRGFEFGEIEEALIYRAMLAILGREVVGAEVPRLTDIETDALFEHAASALSKTITFLRRDAEIPHETLLPYRQPIVVLAKFFHLHPEPTARSRELLSRWLWRGAWSGRHAGDVVSTRRILDLVSQDEAQTVRSLLEELGKERPSFVLEPFNFRHAHSKLEVLGLAALRPRDLETYDELDLTNFSGSSWLFRVVEDGGALGKTIANRLVHRPGSRPIALLQREPPRNVLESHAIGKEASAALAKGDTSAFLERRGIDVEAHLRAFLEAKAKFEANDRPAISALTVPDEDA